MSSLLTLGVNSQPKYITEGLKMYLDAGNVNSYSGTGATWADLSGNGNDCTFGNSPTFQSTYFDFNGTSNYGYLNFSYGSNVDNSNTISEMSVFAWIRTTYNSGTTGVYNSQNWAILDFDRSDVFTFAIDGTGEIQMAGNSVTATGTGGIGSEPYFDIWGNTKCNDGDWHYVGWTFSVSNQEIVMYLDGSVDRTFTANGNLSALGAGLERYGIIGDGCESGTPNSSRNNIYYDGDIALIQFYDTKALTYDEVVYNFNATRGRFGL